MAKGCENSDPEKQMKAAFKIFDSNNVGYIDHNNLMEVCK